MSEQELLPPEKGLGDIAHEVAKTGLGYVSGGPVIALALGEIISPPLAAKMHDWAESVQVKLEALERSIKDYKWRTEINNEMTIGVFLHALSIVTRTHRKEKLEALRNAVVNSTVVPKDNDEEILVFLNTLDGMTVSHLMALEYMCDGSRGEGAPKVFVNAANELEVKIPKLKITPGLSTRIILDLSGWGYLRTISQSYLGGSATEGNISNSYQITEMGKRFIAFIRDPEMRC